MSSPDADLQDDDVSRQAIEALTLAQRRSVEAGHPQVLVMGDKLVRITAGQVVVLKSLPGRIHVTSRGKPDRS